MKTPFALPVAATLFLVAGRLAAADKALVTVTNDSGLARRAETITVPFADIRRLLDPAHADPAQYWDKAGANIPLVRFDNLLVTDAAGHAVPSQVTNYDTKGGRNYEYNDLVFQHDFAAGEKAATFTIEPVATQVPPYPSKVFCRIVPDRLDDIAWENDRIAHRAYGASLELPIAGPDQMPVGGSGIDVWSKRFPYFIIDRWYNKDHNALHTDTGEGLDMYDTGQARGDGGTGVWDGAALHVSRDYRTAKVMANGPIRGVFELGFQPWDAGNGVMVSEVKRYTMDAGRNLDSVEDTFTFTGTPELTIGIGLTVHTSPKETLSTTPLQNGDNHWLSLWEEFPRDGKLGTAVVLAPDVDFAGFARSQKNIPASASLRPDQLVLVKVKSGVPIHFWAGAGWDRSGQFTTNADWTSYVESWAQRVRGPVKVALAAAP
jgi:hypothetical protein